MNVSKISKKASEKLVCSHCEVHLSRAPVYLEHDGTASCSQCVVPERPAIRNKQYEIAARALLFPCKYEDYGCKELIPFVDNDEGFSHEEICSSRRYVCPIDGSSRCDWFGTKKEIMKHCQTAHAEKLLKNPTNLIHNIRKSSMDTFVLHTFDDLFLLYTKVCVTSAKIFHSARFLGASNEAQNFYFTLSIKRGHEMILKRLDVAPQGCLAMQEPTSLPLDINSLLSMLGGYDGVEYTLTILQKKNEVSKATSIKTEEASSSVTHTKEDVVQCKKCKAVVKVLQYRNSKGWLCEICAPRKIICNNIMNIIPGDRCKFEDIEKKIDKHREYFCIKCSLCEHLIGTLPTHYSIEHKYITFKTGTTLALGPGETRCLLRSIAGVVACKFNITDSSFSLFIYSPLTTAQLHEFSCTVKLISRIIFISYSHTFTPRTMYTESWDWSVQIDKNNDKIPLGGQTLNVCIDIKQNN